MDFSITIKSYFGFYENSLKCPIPLLIGEMRNAEGEKGIHVYDTLI
jgi:hypothetical protein